MNEKILSGVERYYSEKVLAHGTTSQGVDWNSKESQYLRFSKLCEVVAPEGLVDLLDYGCGYGELLNYMDTRFAGRQLHYQGYDLSAEMIARAEAMFPTRADAHFSTRHPVDACCDHAIASGLFNVKLDLASDEEWRGYIVDTIRKLDRVSRKGFAFNALTKYSDADRMKDTLHYADPCELFDLCKREFSRNVALLHDYDLYEFTLIVRK